jgi:hypothetical protein
MGRVAALEDNLYTPGFDNIATTADITSVFHSHPGELDTVLVTFHSQGTDTPFAIQAHQIRPFSEAN